MEGNGPIEWTKLIDDFEAQYHFIGNNESEFFFCTSLDAPRRKIISINVETNLRRDVLAEHEKNVIVSVAPTEYALKFSSTDQGTIF